MRCWLCEYAGEPEAMRIANFILENAGTMGPLQLAMTIHEALVDLAPDDEGIGLDEVTDHIRSHTLQPAIRIASILRSLLNLLDKLEGTLMTAGEDGGGPGVDGKNVAIYLKVVSEIMSMYRTGEANRLMFSSCDRTKLAVRAGQAQADINPAKRACL